MIAFLRELKQRLRNRLLPPGPCSFATRGSIAARYLKGNGLEIGALHNPLQVPAVAHVRYVDRMSVPDLRKHYPELAKLDLVPVDVIDDGQTLSSVPDDSQNFIIANHFIEHCEDPIRTLINHFRVLKTDGVLYLAVPDKRVTFDKDRPVTPLAHLYEDFEQGAARSRRAHYEEWSRLVNRRGSVEEIQAEVAELMGCDYSIHFHVWQPLDFLEFLLSLRNRLNFDILTILNQDELIVVLRKLGGLVLDKSFDRATVHGK